jgi:hypothetical protein
MERRANRPNPKPARVARPSSQRSVFASQPWMFSFGPVKNWPVCQYGMSVKGTGSQSRVMDDGTGPRTYSERQASATATMATAASSVMAVRRRVVSGEIHATIARMVAKPAWIHSEARIDHLCWLQTPQLWNCCGRNSRIESLRQYAIFSKGKVNEMLQEHKLGGKGSGEATEWRSAVDPSGRDGCALDCIR